VLDIVRTICENSTGMLEFHVGDIIRKLREKSGITRAELASRAGLRRNTITDIERYGKPERESVEAIAKALGYSVSMIYAELEAITKPPAGTDSSAICDEHKDLHLKLEAILHGSQKWAQCLAVNIEALYDQTVGGSDKWTPPGGSPRRAPEAEIRDDRAPLPKRRKGRTAAMG